MSTMKRIIITAIIAISPLQCAAQSYTPTLDAASAAIMADAVRVQPVEPMYLPPPRFDLRVTSSVDPGPILYPIPGITTYPLPYTPDPPEGSGAPYQPRW